MDDCHYANVASYTHSSYLRVASANFYDFDQEVIKLSLLNNIKYLLLKYVK